MDRQWRATMQGSFAASAAGSLPKRTQASKIRPPKAAFQKLLKKLLSDSKRGIGTISRLPGGQGCLMPLSPRRFRKVLQFFDAAQERVHYVSSISYRACTIDPCVDYHILHNQQARRSPSRIPKRTSRRSLLQDVFQQPKLQHPHQAASIPFFQRGRLQQAASCRAGSLPRHQNAKPDSSLCRERRYHDGRHCRQCRDRRGQYPDSTNTSHRLHGHAAHQ